MAASEKVLGDLHDKVAQALTKAVEGTTIPAVGDEPEQYFAPSPAMLMAALKMLKDNNITAVADKGSHLANLQDAMAKRREKRRLSNVTPEDLDAAEEQADFMRGLN